jgi:hypothetical protein
LVDFRAEAAAIKTAVSHKMMQMKAAELGEKIRGEKGVETAVNFIEKLLLRPHRLLLNELRFLFEERFQSIPQHEINLSLQDVSEFYLHSGQIHEGGGFCHV